MSSKMAWVAAGLYYPVAAAGTYFLGRNIIFRGTTYAVDYLLNSNAESDIKETHTVETITSMLKTYDHLTVKHPAFESKRGVIAALKELQDAIDRTRLKLSVHEAGWVTRFRTFDARIDNVHIERKTQELMGRLDIFIKLIRCPPLPPPLPPPPSLRHLHDNENESNDDDEAYTHITDSITDEECGLPVEGPFMYDDFPFLIR